MTNTQQPTLMKFDNLFLKDIPLNTPFETTGFIKVAKRLPHEVELTIETPQGMVKSFIKPNHPYFVWWRDESPNRAHARLALVLTSPFNEMYHTSIGTLQQFCYEPYVEPTVVNERALKKRLRFHLDTIQDPALQELWRTFLNDNKEMKARFFYAPSSINTAYSFKNGLLAHTIVMMDRIESEVSSATPTYYLSYVPNPLNKDLLKTAALFHDVGKMFAYNLFEGEVTKTDEGELLGKTLLSLEFLHEMYQKMLLKHPDLIIPSTVLLKLKHIIASANRKLEHGAIVVPKTKEADYFAYLENADTSIGNYHDLERKQSEPGFTRLFNRQVYVDPYSGDGSEFLPETEELVEASVDEVNPSNEAETSDLAETTVETLSTDEQSTPMEPVEPLLETPTASEETPEAPSTDSLLAAIEAVAPEFTQVLEPLPSVQPISETQFVETPFIGQEVLAQTTDAVHPDFMTPVMNIPAEWPQTPSTAPVLANGMPVQPILPIQQPIDLMTDTTVFPATQNFPALGDNPFELTNENVLPFSNITPFVPQSETTVDEASSLNTDSASTDETIEEPSKKVASKKTTTKATKSTKSKSDEESKPTTKRTTKSTKSTKTKADEAVKTTTKRTTKSTKSTKSVAEPEVSMN